MKKRIKTKVRTIRLFDMCSKVSLIGVGCGICYALEIDKKIGVGVIILSLVTYFLVNMTIEEIIDDMVH